MARRSSSAGIPVRSEAGVGEGEHGEDPGPTAELLRQLAAAEALWSAEYTAAQGRLPLRARVRGGCRGGREGARGPRGPIKGRAGILGRRAQGKSRRGSRPGIPLRERGIREEEDRADRWAWERSERGRARAGALGVREWLAGPSASGGSGREWVERGRRWAEEGETGPQRLGRCGEK